MLLGWSSPGLCAVVGRHPAVTPARLRAAVHLSGRWLEELGFAIGKKLRVRDSELLVSLATED